MVLQRARELGDGAGEIFVRLDMESSEYTERTVALVEALWADGFHNTGTVLQSYLRRTPDDVERMIALRARVRLVKGAYQEPDSVAFPDKADTDRMFVEEMERLLDAGNYPAIATHDEAIIDAARRYVWEKGISKDSFEFQMLYGVRRDLQARLREEGYNVRVYVPFGESWYPYLMRRLAERPANMLFMAGSIAKESGVAGYARPVAIGGGILAGALAALAWRRRR
jgi:proline dehydrogenase